MKSILFINRVYPPNHEGAGQLLHDLAVALASQGVDVTILTGPCEEAEPKTRIQGVQVIRVGRHSLSKSTFWRRSLGYLSLIPILFWKALRLPAQDIIVTMTDPPMLSLIGPILRRIKGGRLLHWAQDIYPELAEELGVIRRDGPMACGLRRVSNWSLRRHDHIIASGQCMKERLVERGMPSSQIWVIPNWGHPRPSAGTDQRGETFRRRYGLKNRFVVMYAGHLGMVHPIEALLASARKLDGEFPEIVFVMVGQGRRMSLFKSRVEKAGLKNVRFIPPRERGQLSACLAAADVHLACMHSHLLGLVVPSKVYGILAEGRPCLFLGPTESEVARLIRRHRCGGVLDPDDAKGLADQLVHWFANREQWQAAVDRAQTISSRVSFAQSWRYFRALLHEEDSFPPLTPAKATKDAARLPVNPDHESEFVTKQAAFPRR